MWGCACQFINSSNFSLLISQPWRHFKLTTCIPVASDGRQKASTQWIIATLCLCPHPVFLSNTLPISCLTGFSMTDTLAIHRAASTMWTTDCAQKSSNMLLQKKNKQTRNQTILAHAHTRTRLVHRDPTSKKTNNCNRKWLRLHAASLCMDLWQHMGSPLLTKQPKGH